MPSDAVAKFVSDLRKYRLLPPSVDKLPEDLLSRLSEPRAVAKELISRDWLTAYQVNQVMTGRGKELLLGSYVLLEKLGEGGMGAVFKARNWKLDRVVALKLIRKERLTNPNAIKRFHREIRAAAQLTHPNIVRAFDADEVDGTHLLVMELVEGGIDLAKLVKQQGPLPVDAACEYIRQAALGLQHAYERGMVHRDIKPQNLLLAASGNRQSALGRSAAYTQDPMADSRRPAAVVKILDMGLARVGQDDKGEDSTSTLTQEGAVMGTLDYIAPEQARDSHSVDIRADLYSLGCTLFFLLTGRVPFPGGTAAQKLMKHQLDAPPAIQTLRPEVLAGVANVVAQLMAKRAEDRFQTPAELAVALANPSAVAARAELARSVVAPPAPAQAAGPNVFADLLAGDTVVAATTPPPEPDATTAARPLPWKWLACAGAFVMLLLLVILLWPRGGSTLEHAGDPNDKKTLERKLTPEERAALVEKKRLDEEVAFEKKRVQEADHALPTLEAKATNTTFADFALEVQAFKTKYGGTAAAIKAAKMLMKLPSPLDALDPKKLPQDSLDYWKALGREPPAELVGVLGEHRQRHWEALRALAYSPDGKLIAANTDGPFIVYLYDAQTLQLLRCLRGHTGNVSMPAFSPDSRRLATVAWTNGDTTLRLWDTATGQELPNRVTLRDPGYGLAWLPDGKGLLVNAGSRVLRFDADTLKEEWAVDIAAVVRRLVVSSDGRRFAAGSDDGTIRVYDLTGEKPLQTAVLKAQRLEKTPEKFPDHYRLVAALAFLDNSDHLAAAYTGGWVSVWSLAKNPVVDESIYEGPVTALAYLDKDKLLAVGTVGGHLYDCSGPLPKVIRSFGQDAGSLVALAIAPDGKRLVSGGQDGTIRLWDRATGNEMLPLTGITGPVLGISLSADDRRLITGGTETTVRVWETTTSSELRRLENTAGNRGAAFSSDGRYVVSCAASANVCLWNMTAAPGKDRAVLESVAAVIGVTFAPDSQSFAAARADGAIDLWSLTAGKPTRRTATGAQTKHILAVAFAPNSRTMASGGYDETVALWDVGGPDPRQCEVISSKEPGISAAVAALAFAPDGKTLAIGYSHALNSVHLWNLTRQPSVAGRRLERHTGLLTSMCYSPDGRMLASAANNGHIILWDPTSGARIREWQLPGAVHAITFANDGRHLATANGNGTVYFLRLAPSAIKAPSIHPLTELNTQKTTWFPWLADDGLMIYWEANYAIWTVRRKDPHSPFENPVRLHGGRHPTLTPDQLQIVMSASTADGKTRFLAQASRPGIDKAFGEAQPIPASEHCNTPSFSADGLSLYFQRREGNVAEFRVATRKGLAAEWETSQVLPVALDKLPDRLLAWPFVTADGKALLCTHEGLKGRSRIMLWTRPSTDVPFANFTYLEIPGAGALVGRSPRYIEKTSELFFSAPTNQAENGDFGPTAELRVVRNFRLSDYLPKR